MDPHSVQVESAVVDWRQEERYKIEGIYADHIKTEAALFNDAVRVFSSALKEFNSREDVNPVPLRCTHSKQWIRLRLLCLYSNRIH